MDKKEINPRSPQAPETYVSIGVCSCFTPYPIGHLSSNEEGVVRNPMVYPSSDGEGLRFCLAVKPNLMVYLSSNEEGLAHDPLVYPSSNGEGHVATPTDI